MQQQLLGLFSAFICDTGILGLTSVYLPELQKIKRMSEAEFEASGSPFDSKELALQFYSFEITRYLSNFLDRFFSEIEEFETINIFQ